MPFSQIIPPSNWGEDIPICKLLLSYVIFLYTTRPSCQISTQLNDGYILFYATEDNLLDQSPVTGCYVFLFSRIISKSG